MGALDAGRASSCGVEPLPAAGYARYAAAATGVAPVRSRVPAQIAIQHRRFVVHHRKAPVDHCTVAARPARGRLHAAIVTARPRQWIKNALVIAAAGAAGALGDDDVPVRVGLAFLAFCLLASGLYAINDVRDAEEDRRHPRKRLRPVAAGELDARSALALGAGLMLAGLALCAAVRPLLLLVGVGYLALTLSYTRRVAADRRT